MFRQMGSELIYGDDGLIKRGLIVRHLVLPNDIAGLEVTLKMLSTQLSPKLNLSRMSQYYPTNEVTDINAAKSDKILLINRRIREREYEKVVDLLEEFGFENEWIQEFESQDYYKPNFSDREQPFKK